MSTILKRRDTIWPKAKRHTSSIDEESGVVRDPTVPQLHTTLAASEKKDNSSTSLPVPIPTQRPRTEEPKPHLLSRAAGMQNHFRVPTAQSLNHSIVIIEKTVWDLYEAIAFCSNQGEDEPAGYTILSRRKPNIGICALRGTAANRETDLHSFADVLVHLFLPLRPEERDVKTCLEATVYEFYACVRAGKLEVALQ
ncbi:hypothetical protein B0A54_18059 [Friedmanniomyces endolithicus]|uniref:Uncharacterized protein n=1 Tax=Friedmanniomyces endolithicus TaxID=329885 RepID=A0A4U0TNJ2_9PEZI|nr:hypothetical protein B0A54_18059 [Friedmanniomyces endolithicus]